MNQQGVEAWLVHNQHFQEDKGFIELNLNIDFAYNAIDQLVAANLLADIYKMHQTSLVDRAGRAGISIGLELNAEKGQNFSIYGYTEKQPGLVHTLLQDYVALTLNADDLAKAKDRFVKNIANNKKENRTRRTHTYQVGDLVLIVDNAYERARTGKLSSPTEGPYQILAVYDNGNVRIRCGNFDEDISIRRLRPYYNRA